jgi:DNA processing protein
VSMTPLPDRCSGSSVHDQEAYAAALSTLPGMGPATLVQALGQWEPRQAWARIGSGRLKRPPSSRLAPARAGGDGSPEGESVVGAGTLFEARRAPAQPVVRGTPSWAEIARRFDPEPWWAAISARGIRATWPGHPAYPTALVDDPHPPGVLFWLGSLACLDHPCVAVVGTRNATPDGRAVAYELGRDLAAAGICVVSGLALGIDGAAHLGALDGLSPGGRAGPVGVAASGVDIPYPRRHARLWGRVAAAGAILSETPPGRPAQAWRFPTRNRVIAGLVRMVVVVESHASGGSLITAEAALERGIEVRVVPGPVHSPASAGSNQLLYDGPGPVRSARDVLDGLGMIRPNTEPGPRPNPAGPLSPDAAAVLEATGWRPASVNQIVRRSGAGVAGVQAALDELESSGYVVSEGGWWVRRR